MLRWIILIIFFSLFGTYAFQALKTLTQQRSLLILYWIVVVFVFANFAYHSIYFDRHEGFNPGMSLALGLFLSLFVFQTLIVLFLFFEDIIRIPQALYRFFTQGEGVQNYFPDRRKFISKLALGIAAVPLASLLYGMYKGKYNYKVLRYTLEFDTLPKAFDGFTLTQISDIHSGSFDNREKVSYGMDLINEQRSDVILFTGDMVNNKASEVYPWMDLMSSLKAPQGKFSILGNHDYGDYVQWDSEEDKKKNLSDLIEAQEKMGFKVLLNNTQFLEKDGERIALVGVENWGKGGFKKAGDLNLAVSNVDSEDFKILMSHDPSHWEAQVVEHPYPFELTLSGHTHGMQFGIEIPGWFKWSPVKWRYKQWAGVYNQAKQYLNVNRGFGFLAYPGRVGIWPEITVITLKCSQKVV
jgi:predicted MPP superfamily phosphohydrolase